MATILRQVSLQLFSSEQAEGRLYHEAVKAPSTQEVYKDSLLRSRERKCNIQKNCVSGVESEVSEVGGGDDK